VHIHTHICAHTHACTHARTHVHTHSRHTDRWYTKYHFYSINGLKSYNPSEDEALHRSFTTLFLTSKFTKTTIRKQWKALNSHVQQIVRLFTKALTNLETANSNHTAIQKCGKFKFHNRKTQRKLSRIQKEVIIYYSSPFTSWYQQKLTKGNLVSCHVSNRQSCWYVNMLSLL
jgi:hypothetical protein